MPPMSRFNHPAAPAAPEHPPVAPPPPAFVPRAVTPAPAPAPAAGAPTPHRQRPTIGTATATATVTTMAMATATATATAAPAAPAGFFRPERSGIRAVVEQRAADSAGAGGQAHSRAALRRHGKLAGRIEAGNRAGRIAQRADCAAGEPAGTGLETRTRDVHLEIFAGAAPAHADAGVRSRQHRSGTAAESRRAAVSWRGKSGAPAAARGFPRRRKFRICSSVSRSRNPPPVAAAVQSPALPVPVPEAPHRRSNRWIRNSPTRIFTSGATTTEAPKLDETEYRRPAAPATDFYQPPRDAEGNRRARDGAARRGRRGRGAAGRIARGQPGAGGFERRHARRVPAADFRPARPEHARTAHGRAEQREFHRRQRAVENFPRELGLFRRVRPRRRTIARRATGLAGHPARPQKTQ